METNKLWTRDFTIITLGSVVSMLGGQLLGFAMSLLVLDYTGSTFYFALYNITYFVPYVVMPLIAGPFLDRFSRKRTIYTLDFITAALCGVFALIMHAGHLNFALLAAGTFLFGVIGSVYHVAYESFYPLLITPGNFQKAYSVASTLETLTLAVIPVSAFIYNTFGIVPLFAFNVVTYTIAAVFETQIRHEEAYIAKRAEETANEAKAGLKRFVDDFLEGMQYLKSEKGLLAVAVYFLFSSIADGGGQTVTLPYFKGAFPNGEYIYMVVFGCMSAARALGGLYHYRHRLPVEKKYDIALIVYVSINALSAFYLYLPLPAMTLCCIAVGLLGVTSYNIRISATQRYVPDEKKGRFNGAFNTLSMIGMLTGQLFAGLLSLKLSLRLIFTVINLICLAAALYFIGGNREAISKVYNTED
jgi:MFS family permease